MFTTFLRPLFARGHGIDHTELETHPTRHFHCKGTTFTRLGIMTIGSVTLGTRDVLAQPSSSNIAVNRLQGPRFTIRRRIMRIGIKTRTIATLSRGVGMASTL